MKPGPATSTDAIISSRRSFSAIFSASSRGLALASRASTIAALVAMSPCAASRGGSTTTREKSVPAGQSPSLASAAHTACTRANTAAKRCFGEGLSDMGRRLTQIRGRVKKPLVLDQRKAVGHPRDEIANSSGTLGRGLAAGPFQPFRREIAGRFLVAREQVGDDLPGLPHYPHHPGMAVHVLVEKRLDPGLRLHDARRECDHRPIEPAHLI